MIPADGSAGPSAAPVDEGIDLEAVLDHPALHAFTDCIVPPDDHPSAWQAGAREFLRRMLDAEHRELVVPIRDALSSLDVTADARSGSVLADLDDAERRALVDSVLEEEEGPRSDDHAATLRALADLIVQGYYGDPENGGNDSGVSWAMIDYRPRPDGTVWPHRSEAAAPVTAWNRIHRRYDAVVVGAGAGGGVSACVLAEAGLSVLLVERGRWLSTSDLRFDHLRSQRQALGYETLADPPAQGHPRVIPTADGSRSVLATDPRWGNNAMTVGGGTRVYGAQAWRFSAEDFAMASTYGIPSGSSLADWPISYEDLEPYYDRAEWELGVSGDSFGDASAGPRRRDYPMPPFPLGSDAQRLEHGADLLGLRTTAVPLLINTAPYNGRGACIRCAMCVGFGCPGDFKTDTRNTVIPRAVATGRCDVLTEAQVAEILTDHDGRVTGVRLVSSTEGIGRERRVDADEVVLAAGAVETARLLLNSTSEAEPHGLGNNHDQVGRHLQSHVYAGAWGVFDDPVQDSLGPGPGVATTEYRHRNDGIVGGAMIANDFVPTPLSFYRAAVDLGLIRPWGGAAKEGMRHLFTRLLMVMGPVQEVPNPDSRVTVDGSVRDRWDLPVARLSGAVHPEDLRTAGFIAARAADWAKASGARVTYSILNLPDIGPSRGQHQAGTCRMGDDPALSVTDSWGRVWGHDNLRIADASLHVTNGGVNPVLTILALAYRVAGHLAGQRPKTTEGQ